MIAVYAQCNYKWVFEHNACLKPFFANRHWTGGRNGPTGQLSVEGVPSFEKNPATRSDKVTFLLIAIRGGDFLLLVTEKKNLICCFLQELRYSFKVCKKYFSYAEFFV